MAATCAPAVHCGSGAARQSPTDCLASGAKYDGPQAELSQLASMPLSMSAKDVADTSVVPFTSCAESSFCQ